MTESEYEEQSERLKKYSGCENAISALSRKKSDVEAGILSIRCTRVGEVDFGYFGKDFGERLQNTIALFLDSEIETIRKSMEEI